MALRGPVGGGALAAWMWLSLATGIQAQSLPDERRTEGLFGHVGRNGDQRLDLIVSGLAAGGDDTILPDLESGVGGLTPQKSGTYESLSMQLAYVKEFRRATIGVSGRSMAQYFQGLDNAIGTQSAATVGYDLRLRRTRVSLGQSVNVFPLYAVDTTPRLFSAGVAQLPPPVTDDAVASTSARRYNTTADLSQWLGERATLTASARTRHTTFGGAVGKARHDVAGARLALGLTRDFRLVTGYELQQGSYELAAAGALEQVKVHNLDLGVDFNHAFSFSRRTSVGFSSGPSVVRDFVEGTPRYTMRGEAHLNHQIGRTWQLTATYSRGVTFIDGFVSPFLGDTAAVNLGGEAHRRVELTVGASFWNGRTIEGHGPAADRNESVNGNGRVRLVLSPLMSLTGEYRYFHYRFNQTPSFVADLPRWVDRQSLRIGFDLWLPLLH